MFLQALSWELEKVRGLREAEVKELEAQVADLKKRSEEMEDDFGQKTAELVSLPSGRPVNGCTLWEKTFIAAFSNAALARSCHAQSSTFRAIRQCASEMKKRACSLRYLPS
jgi:hypothetical protein